jgi:hypothetical protein
MKVSVLTDDNAAVFASEFPDYRVGCAAVPEQTNVKGAWKQVGRQVTQLFRERLIEEQPDHLRSRCTQSAPLAFGRVGKTCPDVLARELREIPKNLVLRHASGKVPEDVADGDAGTTDARLSEPDGRVQSNALEQLHGCSLRHLTLTAKRYGLGSTSCR